MENLKKEIQQVINLYQSEKFSKAEALGKKLLEKNPKVPFLYNLLGLILMGLKKNDEAIKCYEKGINIHTAGLKPEPIRSKSSAGSMSINAKTDEKKIHPLFKTKSFDDTKQDQNVKQPIPTSNQLQPQQDQVSQMSAETVAGIFDSMFNIFCSRYPMCSRLDQQEKISLGESWLPIFSEYFSGQSKWVLPAIVTLPIILKRFAQVSHFKKEEELKKQYGMDKEPEPEPKPKPEPNKSAWSKMKFGDSTEKK